MTNPPTIRASGWPFTSRSTHPSTYGYFRACRVGSSTAGRLVICSAASTPSATCPSGFSSLTRRVLVLAEPRHPPPDARGPSGPGGAPRHPRGQHLCAMLPLRVQRAAAAVPIQAHTGARRHSRAPQRLQAGGRAAGSHVGMMLRQTRLGPFPDSYRADQTEEAALCARLQAGRPIEIRLFLFVFFSTALGSGFFGIRFAFVFDHSRFRFSSIFPRRARPAAQQHQAGGEPHRTRPWTRPRRPPPSARRRTVTPASPATPDQARPSFTLPTSTRSAGQQLAPATLREWFRE